MDPYLLFRTAPASVKCAMLLRCSGRVDQPVLLILRLDLLKLLLETPTSNANVEEDEKEVKSKAAKETEHPSLIDLVAVLDLQIHIEQMQLCSWPSYQNRKGFVFCQEKLDLQLKLIRAGAGESSSPQVHNALYSEYNGIIVDRLRTEIQQVAVYFRDWVTKRRRPSRGLQDDSLDGGGGVYLRDLMDALYRVFYASTVKVSYLEQNAEDEEELRTKPRSRSPLGESASKQRSPPSSLYRSKAFKPQLTTFEANHLHFVPPVKTMPRSSQVWRSSIEGDDIPKYCGTPAKR